MSTLILERRGEEPFDLALDAPRFALWRRGADVHLTLDDDHVGRVRRALAFRGVQTEVVAGGVPDAPRAVRAVGTALAPVRLRPGDLDLIEVRLVPLSEATARAVRRRIRWWPLGAKRRARCRALLRGSDALFEVRRTVWCARDTIRANRRTLRPVLFDAAAMARTMRFDASEHALTRWIGG